MRTEPSSHTIADWVDGLGFALVGVTPAQPTAHEAFFRQWLAQGKHGQMHYLANHVDKRLDPAKLLPGAKSIICVADRYAAQWPGDAEQGQIEDGVDQAPPATGRLARYAWGADYHKVIKKRLFVLADALREKWPGHDYKAAVDTAPILEREHAQRAGLGWQGKHTLLIHPKLGSWLLLGQIVTTLEIQPYDEPMTDHCGTCTRCIDACPTQCITPYQLDAQQCISYLTIEHRGPIAPDLHPQMGDWIAGCDVCQEVCPFNSPPPDTPPDISPGRSTIVPTDHLAGHPRHTLSVHPRYTPRRPAPVLLLLEILNWGVADRQEAFRGSALKRIKLDMLKRNALIAAGNSLCRHHDAGLLKRVQALADDPDEPELVRLTAQQVCSRLTPPRSPSTTTQPSP